MPHQCVKCSKIIPIGSRELLEGCKNCGGRFFFYIRDEQLKKMQDAPIMDVPEEEKEKVEKDIREMAGITNDKAPVILDIESVRVTGTGKFEIDVVNLFKKDQPIIYKLEEGKYIIDIASTLQKNLKEFKKVDEYEKDKK